MGTDADPTSRSPRLAYRSDRRRRPGALFFCVPGFTRRRPRLRARRGRARRGRARLRAPARARRARGGGRRRARGHGARRGALLRRPDGRARRRRHHRHQRQDHHRLPGPPPARGAAARRPGCSAPSSAWSAAARRRSSARRPRRSTCRPPSGAMLDAGDRACAMEVSSHALELGRATGSASPAAVFTNLTQDHLDFHATMEAYFARQAAAVRRARARRSSTSTTSTGARLAGEVGVRHASRSSARPTTARATCDST